MLDPGRLQAHSAGVAVPKEARMAWTKPRVTEVSLALEINSYACAEVG
jgi:coenzyme PQQ precursor peptide PqqA